MYSEKAPLEIGDIFDRLFRLTGRTVSRTIIVGSIIFLPATIVFAFSMHQFFSGIAQFTESVEARSFPDVQSYAPMIFHMMIFIVSIGIQYIAYFATMVAVTTISSSELEHQPVSWQDAVGNGFGTKLLRTLGQVVLQFLAILGMILIPFVMMFLGKVSLWFIPIGVLGFFCVIPYAIYLAIQWAFTMPAIVLEDANVFESFDRSASLVKGHWWRVFGILFLLTIIIKVVLTIISTPINLIVMWGFISQYIRLILSLKHGAPDQHVVFEMIRSMGFGIGIASSIGTMLFAFVYPILTTIMYFDQRLRKGEFNFPVPVDTTPTVV
jgi:hypothetical protein